MLSFNLQTLKVLLYLHVFKMFWGDTQAANEGRL